MAVGAGNAYTELNARVMSERDLVGACVPIKKKVRGRIVLSERNAESEPMDGGL